MIDTNELATMRDQIDAMIGELSRFRHTDDRLESAFENLGAARRLIAFSVYAPSEGMKQWKPGMPKPFVHNGLAPEGECMVCDRARADREGMTPNHNASVRCQSGGRNHCTCDTCF